MSRLHASVNDTTHECELHSLLVRVTLLTSIKFLEIYSYYVAAT